MARNKQNNPKNTEREAPAREQNDASRKASSGGERGSSNSRNAGADRGIDRARTEPNLTEESTRQGKGKGTNREAVEPEGLDVEELDEQNQEL